jgi:hypothetical protein
MGKRRAISAEDWRRHASEIDLLVERKKNRLTYTAEWIQGKGHFAGEIAHSRVSEFLHTERSTKLSSNCEHLECMEFLGRREGFPLRPRDREDERNPNSDRHFGKPMKGDLPWRTRSRHPQHNRQRNTPKPVCASTGAKTRSGHHRAAFRRGAQLLASGWEFPCRNIVIQPEEVIWIIV